MDQMLFWLVPIASVMALGFAWYFHRQMMKESEGTPQMIKIAAAVRKGAMSYLRQQYKIVGWVFLGLVVLFAVMAYGFEVQNPWVPVAFLTGGLFSGLSGFLGMKTATYASARTANAARNSLNAGLRIAFRSGAVMGLVVVGLGLLDISFWYVLLNALTPEDVLTPTHKLCVITTTMLTFGMGASTQALFAFGSRRRKLAARCGHGNRQAVCPPCIVCESLLIYLSYKEKKDVFRHILFLYSK